MTGNAHRGRRPVIIGCLGIYALVGLVVMVFAFWAAYAHTYDVVTAAGQHGIVAGMTAALPDLLALVGSLHIALALWFKFSPWPGGAALLFGLVLSVAGQVGAVDPHQDWRGYVVAIAPAVVFLVVLALAELLARGLNLGMLAPRATRAQSSPPAQPKPEPVPKPVRPVRMPVLNGARRAHGLVVDALSATEGKTIAQLASDTGLHRNSVSSALHSEELAGQVVQSGRAWRRVAVHAVQ